MAVTDAINKPTRVFRIPADRELKTLRRGRVGSPHQTIERSGVERFGADGLAVTVSGADVTSFEWYGAIPGVQIIAIAGRNGTGFGRLRSEIDGSWLAWRAPGSVSFGPAVQATADGELVLIDGDDRDKWVWVRVYFDHLPGFASSREITISDKFGNTLGGADVSASDASAGLTTSVAFTLTNVSPWSLHHVRAWVDPEMVAVNISDDGAAWVSPTTDAASLLLSSRLASGGSVVLYSQRVIGAGAYFAARTLLGLHLAFGRA